MGLNELSNIKRSKKEKYVTKGGGGEGEKGKEEKNKEQKYKYRKWIKLGIWFRNHRQLGMKVHY